MVEIFAVNIEDDICEIELEKLIGTLPHSKKIKIKQYKNLDDVKRMLFREVLIKNIVNKNFEIK